MTEPGTRVTFIEVGPRDGFQNWPDPVSTPVKLDLIRAALDAGVPRVEATAMVSPTWVPQMADAAEVLRGLSTDLVAEMPADPTRIRVLVPNMRGYRDALDLGVRNVLVNVGVTDGFNRHNLNRSVDETLVEIRNITLDAIDRDVRVDASVSVTWGCPYDGPVAPERAIALAERLVEFGCAEIAFGDTIGVATPTGVRSVSTLALEAFPNVGIAMHFHDTRGMALANALVALECGVRTFEGSVGGIGGCPFAPNSTGNVCSEDLIAMIHDAGYETGVDLEALTEAANRLEAALGKELPGRLHRAGPAPWLVPTAAEAGS
ncbi:MAG: hydroxymethylglutaryl-CoA lyase [Candidatus Dormibacteraeota bacterium]|nr:hydroxymethylglutaryl-CoA lyase [Candidatus Dormibacteraeota bacterium]